MSNNWWCIVYHDLKKIWNNLLLKVVHLVAMFVQIPKQKQDLFVLLKVSRCEALGTRCPVCCNCGGLFTPSVKLDVHSCPNLSSFFTNLIFRRRFYGFSSCGLRGKGVYCGLFAKMLCIFSLCILCICIHFL